MFLIIAICFGNFGKLEKIADIHPLIFVAFKLPPILVPHFEEKMACAHYYFANRILKNLGSVFSKEN